jgi:hypothetical protein
VLVDTEAPGVGLTLYRRGEGPVLASPLRDPGYRVELGARDPVRGLSAVLATAGAEGAEELANTLLAATINGWTDPTLRRLLTRRELRDFLEGGPRRSVRLVFDSEAPLLPDRLPHLLRTETETVLEINLASARAEEASAGALRILAGVREP